MRVKVSASEEEVEFTVENSGPVIPQEELEQFFSYLVPRSKIREATNALLAARELNFVTIGTRSLIQMTPAAAPSETPGHNHG